MIRLPMRAGVALCALAGALALTTPADSAPKRKAHKPRPVCVQFWDPGVGPMRVCSPR